MTPGAPAAPEAGVRLSLDDALSLCERAAIAAGASAETAHALARSSLAAEADGQPAVGIAHFIDYLDALKAGRIDGQAVPELSRPAPAIILSDAKGGAAQTGFDRAFGDLAAAARTFGVAVFSQHSAYTCGGLGGFALRLAEAGLVSIAATNGPALMAGSGSTKPVYCTNPLAFAAPAGDAPPLLIDQASSATAFVNVRKAARDGRPIPEGWAIDANGQPTTDAAAAVKGALLAFGGQRGANIALMVEVLAAGLSGSNWSLDAPSFTSGNRNPGSGLFVLALLPAVFGFEARMADQLSRLSRDYGVHVPGRGRRDARDRSRREGIQVSAEVYRRLAGEPAA